MNNANIIVIGETFFLSNLQHNNVNNNAASPGINESKFCCKVVTFATLRPFAPKALYCSSADFIPSVPCGNDFQSIYAPEIA